MHQAIVSSQSETGGPQIVRKMSLQCSLQLPLLHPAARPGQDEAGSGPKVGPGPGGRTQLSPGLG